jgi:hypothetical protein
MKGDTDEVCSGRPGSDGVRRAARGLRELFLRAGSISVGAVVCGAIEPHIVESGIVHVAGGLARGPLAHGVNGGRNCGR